MSFARSPFEPLRAIAGLELFEDDDRRSAAARDFGGLRRGAARAVVRPATVEALVALVRWASAHGCALTPRGLGLSQSGQSVPIDGLSVEMAAFRGIEIAPDERTVRCGAGATWRELLARTASLGLAPEVVPLNLDLSIGGTLSAGGTGSTSHRYGMAVSSVEAVEVVTGAGELVLGSRHAHDEVYDAVLGGVGQFGFICSVELRLRRLHPITRTACLLYDNLGEMLADQHRLMAEPWCTHIEGFASAAVQGLKRSPSGRRVPFARWFYGMHVSTELVPDASQPPLEERLHSLSPREVLHLENSDSVEFAARYDVRFEAMRATGAWDQIHPWLECMLPLTTAADVLPGVLGDLPLLLGDGHRIMLVADVPRPALLMTPASPPTVAFAILPVGVPPAFEAPALAALRAAHDRLVDAGGKRYLSGWLFEPDEAAWRMHFGDRYESWRARKAELDPQGLLRSLLQG